MIEPPPNSTVINANGQGNSFIHYRDMRDAPEIKFKRVPFDEFKVSTASNYCMKGVFPRKGLVIVWGPAKCGKSFWTMTAELHVAIGRDYRGHRVQQGEILYIALEGQAGFGNRCEALRQRYLEPGQHVPTFGLCMAPLDLIQQQSSSPACVVIDTFNRSLAGSESKDEDIAAYIRAAKTIENTFNCLVVIVHHCGYDESRMRGHSSLIGSADVVISVKKDAASNVIATVEFAKDMPEGASFASRLEVVEIGTDQDGDPITTCVITAVEDGAIPTVEARSSKMPKSAQIGLKAIKEAIDECGEPAPASNHIPATAKVTTIDRWRDYAYRRGISAGEDRAKQKAFKMATEYLIASEAVGTWDQYVWQT
jgi:hypothetical protein